MVINGPQFSHKKIRKGVIAQTLASNKLSGNGTAGMQSELVAR